jgi:hypothetical protein
MDGEAFVDDSPSGLSYWMSRHAASVAVAKMIEHMYILGSFPDIQTVKRASRVIETRQRPDN